MPDPPRTLSSDQVTNFSKLTEQVSKSPGLEISSSQNQDDPKPASQNTARRTLNYDQSSDFAYGANPALDTVLSNTFYTSSNANTTHDADTTDASYPLDGTSANATVVPNLNLASFGSQPWPATAAPYLDFAPQPIYEPTGELINERNQPFANFDHQQSSPQHIWHSEKAKIVRPPQPRRESGEVAQQYQTAANEDFIRPRSALKRNRNSDAGANESHQKRRSEQELRPDVRKLRRVSFEQMSGIGPASAEDEESSSSEAPQPARQPPQGRGASGFRRGRGSVVGGGTLPRPTAQTAVAATVQPRSARGNKTPTGHPPSILPPEKVFPIQIGSELFRLSGASISSDAPSYFTQFFEDQIRQNEESGGVRTLYIDRDSETFRDVARHLQGYYIKPRDGSHFVKLFADAQFYSLPRLINQLFESEIFIQIGEKHFQIPKDIFSDPGNSPNFFSLGFAVFFSSPGEVFPGLDRRGLLRPPSITPPYVPGRSAETFAQLLHLLRGYPLHIENEEHRAELLRDCRYFHLRGLEQKIIAHEISYNLERQRDEICLRIEDIKPSGISYKADDSETERNSGGWVYYARPFVDDVSYELVVEIGGESTTVNLNEMRADFHGLAKARVSSLFQVVANKMNLPTNAPLGLLVLGGTEQSPHTSSPGRTPLSEDKVKILFEPASDIWLDGSRYEIDWSSTLGYKMSHGPIKSADDDEPEDSDMMSEVEMEQNQPTQTRSREKQQGETLTQSVQIDSSTQQQVGSDMPPQWDSAGRGSRKRRRPNLSSASGGNGNGDWIVRSAQWRLRIRPSDQDTVRGRYEVVFIAVKVDAFSQERARNSRRKFLTAG